jgi:hypothetical protein
MIWFEVAVLFKVDVAVIVVTVGLELKDGAPPFDVRTLFADPAAVIPT